MDFSDKENVFRLRLHPDGTAAGKNTKPKLLGETSEQLRLYKKQKIPHKHEGQDKSHKHIQRQRVPFGGKDQNLSGPTLQRSHSSGLSYNDAKQQQRKRALRPSIPHMKRAISSIETGRRELRHNGFTKLSLSNQRSVKDTLSPLEASRSIELTQGYDSDSLIKKQHNEGYRLVGSEKPLGSSLTNKVNLLHARNILDNDVNKFNVDPTKKRHQGLKTEVDEWLDAHPSLLDDEIEPQTITSKPSALTNDKYGIEPLDEDFLRKLRNRGPRKVVQDESIESNQDLGIEEVSVDLQQLSSLDEEENSQVLQENGDIPVVGLNEDDMYDLLD